MKNENRGSSSNLKKKNLIKLRRLQTFILNFSDVDSRVLHQVKAKVEPSIGKNMALRHDFPPLAFGYKECSFQPERCCSVAGRVQGSILGNVLQLQARSPALTGRRGGGN